MTPITIDGKVYNLCDLKTGLNAAQMARIMQNLQDVSGSDVGSFLQAIVNFSTFKSEALNTAMTKFLFQYTSQIAEICRNKNLKLIFLSLFLPENQSFTVEYDSTLESIAEIMSAIPLQPFIEGMKSFFGSETIADESSTSGLAAEA